MKGRIFIFLLITISAARAQKVKIVGKADPMYFGREISVVRYADYLSEREILLDRDSVLKPGFFTLEFELNTTSPVFLRVDNMQGTLYAEPGKTYKIGFTKKDSADIVTIGNTVPVRILFMDMDSTDLNYLIHITDQAIGTVLEKHKGTREKDQKPQDMHPDTLERKKNQNNVLLKKLDTIEARLSRRFGKKHMSHPYFNTYFRYSFALARLPLIGSRKAWDRYISGKPVRYHMKEYMDFMKAFYEAELEGRLYSEKVFSSVNGNESFPEFKEHVRHDTYTPNDTLLELAALIMTKTAFGIKLYKPLNLCNMLHRAAGELKNVWHKSTALNLHYILCRVTEGADVTDLRMKNRFGKEISLYGFGDKYVYLMFWRSDITVCEEQLRLIPALKKKYGNKVAFLSVFIDEDTEAAGKLLKKYPSVNWEVVYAGKEKELAEYFRVKAVPMYFLINPFHRLQSSPAPEPGTELEMLLQGLGKKK